MLLKACLYCITILTFFGIVNIVAGIDVAIYTEAHPWSQNLADTEVTKLSDLVKAKVNIELFGPDKIDDLANWVKAHTNSQKNILILLGILPTTIYQPGNTQKDGSLVENYLDAGNTIINTGEYTFYSVEGKRELNESQALQNIIDVPDAFVWQGRGDNWRPDPVVMKPTADGNKYTPSLKEFGTSYPFHEEDYSKTTWNLEIALAENIEEDRRVDPGIIVNKETDGRLGIFLQAYVLDIPTPDVSWGTVMGEYILNYYLNQVASVQADDKLTTTWGKIKL